MTGVEITLILVGIIFVLVSFFVQEKLTPKDVQEITRLSEKELKIIVERELKNANDKVRCNRCSGRTVPGECQASDGKRNE